MKVSQFDNSFKTLCAWLGDFFHLFKWVCPPVVRPEVHEHLSFPFSVSFHSESLQWYFSCEAFEHEFWPAWLMEFGCRTVAWTKTICPVFRKPWFPPFPLESSLCGSEHDRKTNRHPSIIYESRSDLDWAVLFWSQPWENKLPSQSHPMDLQTRHLSHHFEGVGVWGGSFCRHRRPVGAIYR